MTIFNSQRVNNDSKPYRNKYDGSRWVDPGVDSTGSTVIHDPRPEYDNNPNPILLSFREDTKPHAQSWLSSLDPGYIKQTFGEHWWTHEEVKHAQKVLTRLVNVYGDKEN